MDLHPCRYEVTGCTCRSRKGRATAAPREKVSALPELVVVTHDVPRIKAFDRRAAQLSK